MKKIILALFLLSSSAPLFAEGFMYSDRPQASHPFATVCSTFTATKLFTDDGTIIDVMYDNQSLFSIAIATWPATVTSGAGVYILPSGRTNYSNPPTLKGACFIYGITIGTTTAQTLNGVVEQ